MGNRFSTDPAKAEILVRTKEGKLVLYKDTMDKARACNRLPVPMEAGVNYMFLPSSGFHAHPYYDSECETPGNDLIESETSMGGKNLNVLKHTPNSNSYYFEMNKDLPNTPDYPIFYSQPDGFGEARKTSKRGFDRCTMIPYAITPSQAISFSHNNTPLAIFTDSECKNEYIIPLSGESNVDNRTIANTLFTIPYSKVTSYTEPATTTNAMYYRAYRDYYPNSTPEERARVDLVKKTKMEAQERIAREAQSR